MPPPTAFWVTVSDDNAVLRTIQVNEVSISNDTVTLTLASPVFPCDVLIQVSYNPSGVDPANRLQDAIGNPELFLRRWTVANTRQAPGVSAVAFTSQPSGPYSTPGNHIEVTLTFNKSVTVSGAPRIELSPAFGPDGETRYAVYVSGSPGATLVFRYALVEGDDSDDANVSVAASALDADGADGSAAIRTTGDAEDVSTEHAAADSGKLVSVVGMTTATADAGEDQEVETGATVTLDGSGSSTLDSPTFTYAWTQTSGDTVTLSDAAAAMPTFTAPSVRTDLVFSLVVNDGNDDSLADTVTVAVRPPLSPTDAPCQHPAPEGANFVTHYIASSGATDDSIRFGGTGAGTFDLWFCRPDGTSQQRATGGSSSARVTVSGLSSGTTYWISAKQTEGSVVRWDRWQAVTTTGGASIVDVRFTSSPTHDADSDGTADTYLIGETIQAQVTWSQNVTVANGGDDANVSLRLDLGDDDADPANSQRKMAYVSGSGTGTLTFGYTVQRNDMDSDGVWLQTASATDDTIVFLENGATLTGGNPDTNNAVRTRADMPTTGDAAHKVDWNGDDDAPPDLDSGEVTGATVTLTFDEALKEDAVPPRPPSGSPSMMTMAFSAPSR